MVSRHESVSPTVHQCDDHLDAKAHDLFVGFVLVGFQIAEDSELIPHTAYVAHRKVLVIIPAGMEFTSLGPSRGMPQLSDAVKGPLIAVGVDTIARGHIERSSRHDLIFLSFYLYVTREKKILFSTVIPHTQYFMCR
jgi:hypothetical protein